jgi:hypothetical protein
MSDAVLLVEGDDDQHVVWALCKAHDLPECFTVEGKGGKDPLLAGLPGYLKNPTRYPQVGVLLDADVDLPARWSSVAHQLQTAGYSLPSAPPVDGLVLDHPDDDGPRIGVWLMPDNRLPGMLEDFARMLIPDTDELAFEADNALNVIGGKGLQRYAPRHRPKAFIHTWLAWQEEPGRPMGAAITRRYLDPVSDQAERFVAWLRRLFLDK